MMFPKSKPIRNSKLLKQFHEFCEKYNIGCLLCLSRDIQIHHGIYRSQQGSDEFKNLYPLCQVCHDKTHFVGVKDGLPIIKKEKRRKWLELEQRYSMDLSSHLDS